MAFLASALASLKSRYQSSSAPDQEESLHEKKLRFLAFLTETSKSIEKNPNTQENLIWDRSESLLLGVLRPGSPCHRRGAPAVCVDLKGRLEQNPDSEEDQPTALFTAPPPPPTLRCSRDFSIDFLLSRPSRVFFLFSVFTKTTQRERESSLSFHVEKIRS